MPDPPDSPRRARSARRLWPLAVIALLLFGANFWIASNATQPQQRVRVPYSPVFLNQARAQNVKEITSTGTAVQGTFRHAVSYRGTRSTDFATEIPEFADAAALARLLEDHGVVINAKPLETSAPLWETLLFGFGPTLVLLGLLFWIFRRAAAGGGMLGTFTRSRARRYDLTRASA